MTTSRIAQQLPTSYLSIWSRKDASRIESAIRAMWPKGCDSLTIEECADLAISKITSEFKQHFGSDYQDGITREHYVKLFWLAIPRIHGPDNKPILPPKLRVSECTFTHAIAALYRPKYKEDMLSESPFWQRRYRYYMASAQTSVIYKDVFRATISISSLWEALHNTDEIYYGIMSKTERDELRKRLAEAGIDEHFYYLAESTFEGRTSWGVNLKVALPFPIRHDGNYRQFISVFLGVGKEMRGVFWYGGGTIPSAKLSAVTRDILQSISNAKPSREIALQVEEEKAKEIAQAHTEAQAWHEGLLHATKFSGDIIREIMEFEVFGKNLANRP